MPLWPLKLRARFDPVAALAVADHAAGDHRMSDGDRNATTTAYYRRAARSGHPHAGPPGWVGLGRALARTGDGAGAERAFQTAIDTGHADAVPAARIALAEELCSRKRPDADRALDLMRQVADGAHPERAPEALLWLARHWDHEGDAQAAIDAYERAAGFTTSKRSSWALMELGDLHARRGDRESAAAVYRIGAERIPDPRQAAWAARKLREVTRKETAEPPRPAEAFGLDFADIGEGERIFADPGRISALLVELGRDDLLGARSFGAPTEDGYRITFVPDEDPR